MERGSTRLTFTVLFWYVFLQEIFQVCKRLTLLPTRNTESFEITHFIGIITFKEYSNGAWPDGTGLKFPQP